MCRKEAKGRGSANVHRQPSGDKDEGASICWCLLPTVVRSAHCNEEDMPTVMRFGVGYVYVLHHSRCLFRRKYNGNILDGIQTKTGHFSLTEVQSEENVDTVRLDD